MSDGVIGHGATLVGATTGTIGNITDLTAGSVSVSVAEYTTMDSTDKWKEFLAATKDAGEITFTCNYDGASGGTANDIYTNVGLDPEVWTVTFNDNVTGSKLAASGFISGVECTGATDDVVTMNVTIKLTGALSHTANSGS